VSTLPRFISLNLLDRAVMCRVWCVRLPSQVEKRVGSTVEFQWFNQHFVLRFYLWGAILLRDSRFSICWC
jgi:hypothetical protein